MITRSMSMSQVAKRQRTTVDGDGDCKVTSIVKQVSKSSDTDSKFNSLPPLLKAQITALNKASYNILVDKFAEEYQSMTCKEGTSIGPYELDGYSKRYNQDERNKLVQNVISDLPVYYAAEDRDQTKAVDYCYDTKLEGEVVPSNQLSTGRCWMFAGLNIFRRMLINKLKLPKTFELSHSYLFFFNKLEYSNIFLEEMIALRHCNDNDDLLLNMLDIGRASPVSDGGTWHFFANLVQKYGVLPKTCYNECNHTSQSDEMNNYLMSKLAEYTMRIRRSSRSDTDLRMIKDNEMIPEIYKMLANFMGEPPKSFTWRYEDTSQHVHTISNLTPVAFYQTYIGSTYRIQDKVVLIHDPRPSSKKNHCYTPSHFANMVHGKPNVYVNVNMSVMKKAVEKSISKLGEGVWFGCDVGRQFLSHRGLLDDKSFNASLALNTDFAMDKHDRLVSRRSTPSHAMLIVGVHTDRHNRKWRIENSWGHNEKEDDPGFLQMSDSWMSENVFEVVVDRSCLPDKVLEKIALSVNNPTKLDYNDPFGTVATCECCNKLRTSLYPKSKRGLKRHRSKA